MHTPVFLGNEVLKKPLIPPSYKRPCAPQGSPEDTRRNFLLVSPHLVELKLLAVPRFLLWPKGLKGEPPDISGRFATHQKTGGQREQVFSVRNKKNFSGFKVWIGHCQRGCEAERPKKKKSNKEKSGPKGWYLKLGLWEMIRS